MSITLWIVQIVLALVFALTGLLKVSQPVEGLRKRMSWAQTCSPWPDSSGWCPGTAGRPWADPARRDTNPALAYSRCGHWPDIDNDRSYCPPCALKRDAHGRWPRSPAALSTLCCPWLLLFSSSHLRQGGKTRAGHAVRCSFGYFPYTRRVYAPLTMVRTGKRARSVLET